MAKKKSRHDDPAHANLVETAARIRRLDQWAAVDDRHEPPKTPTPNRVLKAGDVRVDAHGAFHCDSILVGLANRCALAPRDRDLNGLLLKAGERYFMHWSLGYRVGVGAQDMNRVVVSGSVPAGLSAAESAVYHARQYQQASRCLGPMLSAAVDAIVLNEEPVESVGRRISGYNARVQAIAAAMDRLRCGLTQLAALWGMLALDPVATNMHRSCHESEARSDGAAPSRALRTHRSLAGMG
jgi:hypothetical protein